MDGPPPADIFRLHLILTDPVPGGHGFKQDVIGQKKAGRRSGLEKTEAATHYLRPVEGLLLSGGFATQETAEETG